MLIYLLAVIVGLAVLAWSSDRFVEGAVGVARHLGVKPMVIGVVILGFGTSAPEFLVSILSVLEGSSGLAVGNVFGSNIANIAFILGVTAIVSPIFIQSEILRKELPIVLGSVILVGALVWDKELSRMDALICVVVFGVALGYIAFSGKKAESDPLESELNNELDGPNWSLVKSIFWLIVGFALLAGSSRGLIWGAVNIAELYGVSDLVIGLTIVAIGTSLPELASTIAAARKGEHEMAFGNILGSNLFNTLAVSGVAGLVRPLQVESVFLTRDLPINIGLTAVLFLLGWGRKSKGSINRFEGALLAIFFASYMGYLVFNALGE
ncbi:calcium/sodium antiporter [Puniceicoccaceae bacterium K14]|nr:calcium/sodium antiporter [Puniceicoccaceae bacterium K14]